MSARQVPGAAWSAIRGRLLEKYGYADEISPSSRAWLQTNKTLFAHGHPEPYGANMQAVYNLLGQPLQAIALTPSANPQALLRAAAVQVNATLTGYTPPAVMARRRAIAGTIFGLLIIVAVIFAVRGVRQVTHLLASPFRGGRRVSVGRGMKAGGEVTSGRAMRAGDERTEGTGIGAKLRRQIMAWAFMLPALASILVWAYYPLLRGLIIAFQDYKIILGAHFVGLDNFIDVFTSETVWRGLLNSALFTVYSIVIGFFLPIFLALLLAEVPRGTVLFRILLYLPAVTTGLVTVYLWKYFEDPNPTGLFNTALAAMHIPPQKWLTDPHWALISVVLPGVWAAAGPGSIIYLAALKSIPPDMYEAADLDGAGVWDKLFKVTLPILRPLILINLVGAVIASFKATETVLIMTGGGPLYATHTIGLEIFYNAYLYLRFGYATAAAWLMGSLLVGFTLFQLRTMRNMRFAATS